VEKIFAHRDIGVPSLRDARDDVPAALDAIAARMMAKSAAARFQSMAELIAALEALVTDDRAPLPTTTMHVAAPLAPAVSPATASASPPPPLSPALSPSVSPASAAPPAGESATAVFRSARDRLQRFIEGCGAPDKFIDRDEEQIIYRRGGELDLSLAEIEMLLDACCAVGGWTRHSRLAEELSRRLLAAIDDDGAIARDEFDAVIDHAVERHMPRKSAEEHCLTLMLDRKWHPREGLLDRWFQRKLKQSGLE
jgi:hypothetical protein